MAKRILFISSTRVGDAILSTGLLGHLIETYPDAKITIACGPAAEGLFEAVPNLERIVVLDKMVFSFHWLRLWAICGWRFWDVVVDLRNTPVSYLFMGRQHFRLHRKKDQVHRIHLLSNVLNMSDNPPAPTLWTADIHEEMAKALIPDGGPVIAIGPTANWQAKTWPADNFAELTTRLTGDDGLFPNGRIAVFGRDDERPMALRLIETIPEHQRLDLVGELDLLTVYACLKRCDFYIGNDSGLMHLAATSGIPTLGLFGPTQEIYYAPWGDQCAVVRTTIPFDEIFPKDFDHKTSGSLMESLTVDMAEEAVRELWQVTHPEGCHG